MPQPPLTADRLFDRPWRPGHVARPRQSWLRRWGILGLFLLLCSTIFAYLHYTDSARVRSMAQTYLTDILGGRVEIGGATLSIFEGLRLDDVRVYVDDDTEAVDAVLFSADTFLIKYDPRVLVTGRIEAEQIIAIDPHVRITENVDTGRWNYQRMVREQRTTTAPSRPGRPMTLPQVMLRNAQVDYGEIRNGEYTELGSMAIEGQLMPSSDGKSYHFELQSRGAREGIGPAVVGSFARATGQVSARLDRFEFGRDIRSMLPAEVRTWWEQHGLSGRVNVPVLTYTPPRRGQPAQFTVETELVGVTLNIPPEEWMSSDELRRRDAVRWLYETAASLRRGGFGLQAAAAEAATPRPEELRGMTRGAVRRIAHSSLADHLAALFILEPIKLQRVSGNFVFTKNGVNDGIDVEVGGRVEDNAFAINGRIDGFSPLAPAHLTVSSLRTEHIFIPPAPRYMNSMPRQVQQIYNHLRPQGTCSLFIEVNRPTAGAKPEVSGEIAVVDGSFMFDRFPYPVRKATGRIVFGPDEKEGWDRLEIVNLRGLGVADGPNSQSPITVRGVIGPLTGDAGVNVRIEGPDVHSEPALSAAFPSEVRDALRIFDPAGKGEQPVFHGGFACDVIRPPGKYQKWTINTDVTLTDASGALTFFPYPLQHVRGKLLIRDGFVDIEQLTMNRGEGRLVVDGRVSWKDNLELAAGTRQPVVIRPDLTVTARNVPIDTDLLASLPDDRRAWLQRIGLGGKLDLAGRVFRKADADAASAEAPAPDELAVASNEPHRRDAASMIDHDFQITLKEGSAWPSEGTFALSELAGTMRLTSDRLVISELVGRRGDAALAGRGSIGWGKGKPAEIALSAEATNLALDTSLYGVLPAGAKQAWDEVRPEGTVDLSLSYTSDVAATLVSPSPREERATPVSPLQETVAKTLLKLEIKPRDLAATLKAVPYRLENVKGAVTLDGDAITLTDLTANHGGASIKLSGTGSTRPNAPWDLKLAADDMPVDADFTRAVPEGLSSLIESLKVAGKVSFDFSKLIVRTKPRTPDAAQAVATTIEGGSIPATQPANVDVDFATRITTSTASLDVGVPLSDVNGALELAGTVRDGKMSAIAGVIDVKSMSMADRPAGDFHAELRQAAGTDRLQIGPMHGRLAGGELSGQVDLDTPDVGPSTYAMNLVLRNADVKQIAADVENDVSGKLSASLALEGNWSDPTARRGRGDVRVEGREMYKVPLVLGLLQVTNLSLPLTSPFNEADAAYSVDGTRVTFENLALRSREMLMQGTGSLDFETKKVRMTFTTDNPNWPKLPIVGAFVEGAKHELLQIHVRGTLTEPKVSARAINTLSTTVDEVLRGDSKN